MAFCTSAKGRRMLFDTHSAGGGRGCPGSTPMLELLVSEVPQRQQHTLAHPRSELLVFMPAGDLLRVHLLGGRQGIDPLPELEAGRQQVDPAVVRGLDNHRDLFAADRRGGADGHLPRRSIEARHVGVHEGKADAPSADAYRHGTVGAKDRPSIATVERSSCSCRAIDATCPA